MMRRAPSWRVRVPRAREELPCWYWLVFLLPPSWSVLRLQLLWSIGVDALEAVVAAQRMRRREDGEREGKKEKLPWPRDVEALATVTI